MPAARLLAATAVVALAAGALSASGAAYAGAGHRTLPEHVLLALIWDETRLVGLLLEGVGRTPVQLQAALASFGVSVPDQPPPVE